MDVYLAGSIVGQLVIAGVLAGLVWLFHVLDRRASAHRWERFLHRIPPGARVLRIDRVYLHARRGSKAWASFIDEGVPRDVWFEGWQARPGCFVAVRQQTGYGPHSGRSNVVYVDAGGVLEIAGARLWAAWVAVHDRPGHAPTPS